MPRPFRKIINKSPETGTQRNKAMKYEVKFKEDSNLKIVAEVAGKPAWMVSRGLCAAVLKSGVTRREESEYEDLYRRTVMDATQDSMVADVCECLFKYLGVDRVTSYVFYAFCNLVFWGMGDCPYCGGKLEFYEYEGHELHDGDYWTPNSWVWDKAVYYCPVCDTFHEREITN